MKLAWYKLNGSPLAVEVHIVLRKFAFDDRMFHQKQSGSPVLVCLYESSILCLNHVCSLFQYSYSTLKFFTKEVDNAKALIEDMTRLSGTSRLRIEKKNTICHIRIIPKISLHIFFAICG